MTQSRRGRSRRVYCEVLWHSRWNRKHRLFPPLLFFFLMIRRPPKPPLFPSPPPFRSPPVLNPPPEPPTGRGASPAPDGRQPPRPTASKPKPPRSIRHEWVLPGLRPYARRPEPRVRRA